MQSRITRFLLAYLHAFGAWVFGGLALLGGTVTWAGDSQHPTAISWALVVLFASLSGLHLRSAATRLKCVFQPPVRPATEASWSLPARDTADEA